MVRGSRTGRNPAGALAAPGPGEVQVRALHGALSRGTERLIFSGRVPAGEYERMRAPHMAAPTRFRSNTAMRPSAGWSTGPRS